MIIYQNSSNSVTKKNVNTSTNESSGDKRENEHAGNQFNNKKSIRPTAMLNEILKRKMLMNKRHTYTTQVL